MGLKQMVELIEKQYGTTVTIQTLYNWCVKFDLLKYRGKGRKMGSRSIVKKPEKSPMQVRIERQKRDRLRQAKLNQAIKRKNPPR